MEYSKNSTSSKTFWAVGVAVGFMLGALFATWSNSEYTAITAGKASDAQEEVERLTAKLEEAEDSGKELETLLSDFDLVKDGPIISVSNEVPVLETVEAGQASWGDLIPVKTALSSDTLGISVEDIVEVLGEVYAVKVKQESSNRAEVSLGQGCLLIMMGSPDNIQSLTVAGWHGPSKFLDFRRVLGVLLRVLKFDSDWVSTWLEAAIANADEDYFISDFHEDYRISVRLAGAVSYVTIEHR